MRKPGITLLLLTLTLFLASCSGMVVTLSEQQVETPLTLPDPDSIISPPLDFEPPRAERIVLENGLTLYFMEDRELPLVNLRVAIRAGSVFDPPGMEGLAQMTGTVMRSGGTRHMNPDEMDDALDELAAEIGVTVTAEHLSLSLNATVDTFDRALELFGEIFHNPRFCETRLETARNITLDGLKRLPDNPQRLAFREMSRVLHVDDHWGRPSSIASINTIDRTGLVSFHDRYIRNGQLMIAAAGAISSEEIRDKLNDLFDSRPPGDAVLVPSPPEPRKMAPAYYLARPLPQSIVITGYPAPGRQDDDYYAMQVLNTIAGGGGFQSRIMTEIRTRRGLAYSAGSFYQSRTTFGIFAAYVMTRSDATVTVVDLTDAILEDLSLNPLDEASLQSAQQWLTSSHVFSFTSAIMIAEGQMMNELQGLPEDFLFTFPEGINGVTARDVQRVAGDYLRGDHRVLFVLGDPEAFRDELVSRGPLQEVRSDLLGDHDLPAGK